MKPEVLMHKLAIVTLGEGGGVPSTPPLGNTNFAIVIDPLEDLDPVHQIRFRKFWLVDCGPETVHKMAELDAFKNLQGVFITHGHADHSGGLCSLAWRMTFVEKRKVHLIVPTTVYHLLQYQTSELAFCNAQWNIDRGVDADAMATLEDYFNVRKLCDSDRLSVTVAEDPDIRLCWKAFPVDHNITCFPAYGLTLDVETDGRGYQVVFSGDTAHPLPVERIRDADVVYHDCQFYNAGDGREVHVPYNKLRDAIPPELRTKVALCHTRLPKDDQPLADGFRWASMRTAYEMTTCSTPKSNTP